MSDTTLREALEALAKRWDTYPSDDAYTGEEIAVQLRTILARHPKAQNEEAVVSAAIAATDKIRGLFRELGDWEPNENHELDYCLSGYLEQLIRNREERDAERS